MFRFLRFHTCAHYPLRPPVCALVLACLLFGCNGDGGTSGNADCCDPDAEAILLFSKIDDDDGDGNVFDEDFPTINDEDDDIADHTWIRDAVGVYHLFFQTEGLYAGSQIEHYTTTDLRVLRYVGTALEPEPGGWDHYGLWAPHVIKHDGTYYMFYTGVTGRGSDPDTKQRIGVATSTDLVTWRRYPANHCPGTSGDGCIYECIESWTTAGGPEGSYNQQCRDPFTIWDADNNRWLMFLTAKSTNGYAEVAVAHSTDLVHWDGSGFIDATRRLPAGTGGQTTGGQAENAFVMVHDDTQFLLFTDWQDPEDSVIVQNPRTITQYATSPALDVDSLGSASWTYRGYIPDVAVNAIEVQEIGDLWLMSQSISNQRAGLPKLLRRHLRLKCVEWTGPFTFDTMNAVVPCNAFPWSHSNPLAADAMK